MNNKEKPLIFSNRVSLPMILQDEMAECGHACIAMISNFWGHKLDLYSLRKFSKPSMRGTTLHDINQCFEQLGFITRALRVPLSELHLIKCPAVLHWNMNHFVVLKRVKKNSVIIHDPALGVRTCSLQEVSQSFTGIVLEIEKAQDFKRISTHKTLGLYDLVKTVTGVNKLIALLLALSLFIEIFSLFNPLFLQYVTDQVIGSGETNNVYALAAGFSLLIIIHVFTEYIRGNLVLYMTTHLTESFSSNIVKHLLKLPLSFFESRHKGDIQSKFQAIDQIQKKVSTDFINTILDGLMVAVNLIVMLIYSRILTSIVMAALLLYVAIRYVSYQSLKKQTAASIHQHAKVASIFLETLQAIAPIKSFLKEGMRFNTWRNGYIDSLNADIHVSRIQILYHAANQLLFNLEYIVVICIGAKLVLMNQFSVGMLIAFLAYRLLLVNKASSFIQHLFDYKLITIQLGRLSDILFQHPEAMPEGRVQVKQTKGTISLKNVSFKYNETGAYAFNPISLDIKAGEKIALIGPSGCGKSTLIKVMMGLLKQTAGDIYIDHTAMNDFGLKNYRDLTASVMQDDALLSGSILDNIAFFDDDIDLEQVYNVAKLACIHDTIHQLPMRYDTLVGDMGSTISGGQKQRILLARALYRKPTFLFLDEATSHLDDANEKNINQSLKTLNITQIIVAHRQESINMADRIIDLGQVSVAKW